MSSILSYESLPTISCIIPTYRRSDTLMRAINSVLNQTNSRIELLIIDDNHPNDSYSLEVQQRLRKVKDFRQRYFQQEEHKNGAVARNYGVLKSKGEYIAFLDDDDEWLPNKLELQLQELMSLDSTYGGVSCLTSIYKKNKKINETKPFTEKNLSEEEVHSIILQLCLKKQPLLTVVVMENLNAIKIWIFFLE